MARTKHSGLRSRAGPKSRKKRVPKAQKEAESATQLESSEAQACSQQKRLQLTPHVSLLLTVKRLRPLPPELHRCILQHVRRLHNRPTLLACGLVCRAWFHFCKQYLFRNIILKSSQQVNLVVECLANPDSGVYLAKSISMEQKEDQPPWGHAVLLRLAGRLPNVREIIFDNSSPFQSGGEDLKALVKAPTETFCSHPSMTMLLPMLFSRFDNLATLRLDLYCFRSLTDLLRLVASLPKLRALGCHRLSWKHIPASSSIAYRRSTCPQLRSLTITRCPSVWPMLHFFDAPAVFRKGLGLETSARSTICDLVTSSCPSSTACPGMDFAETQVTCEIGALYGLGSSSVNPDLQVKCKWSSSTASWILQVRDIYHIHELQFHLSATGVPYNNNSPARIREIIFVSHSGLHRTGDVVPEELGVLLSKLPYLDRVVFDAAWDSAAKQTALAGFDEGLANKVEVALGAAAKAWQGTSRGGG